MIGMGWAEWAWQFVLKPKEFNELQLVGSLTVFTARANPAQA